MSKKNSNFAALLSRRCMCARDETVIMPFGLLDV